MTVQHDFPAFGFKTRVLPVVVLTHVDQAVPLSNALLEGGVDAIEITLRHASALSCIEKVSREVSQMHVGAGTVTRVEEVGRVQSAGATFALSPGVTQALHEEVVRCKLPFIPGVFTPSEVMQARELGYRVHKLFPATQAGGIGMVKALAGPLPDVRLCPTGGVSPDNLREYLAQPNVAMVGGTWLAPVHLIEAKEWKQITLLARQASELANVN